MVAKKKYFTAEEVAAGKRESYRKFAKYRWKCDECDLEMLRTSMGPHLTSNGHIIRVRMNKEEKEIAEAIAAVNATKIKREGGGNIN